MAGSNKLVEPIYPYTQWEIVEDAFNIANNARNETIFSLGNGYIGWRGTFEEGLGGPTEYGVEGTYLNGFYESHLLQYPEAAYGFATNGQTMLNVTNGKVIKLTLEDEPFDMRNGTLLEYRRVLALRDGTLTRELVWQSPQGREITLITRRLVCLANRHLAAISYQVTPLNFSGKVTILSELNGDVTNLTSEKDPRLGSALKGRVLNVIDKILDGSEGALVQRTKETKFTLVCAMENEIQSPDAFSLASKSTDYTVSAEYKFDARQGEPIQLFKYITYVTDQDYPTDSLISRAKELLREAKNVGFAKLAADQLAYLSDFWANTDIEIKGDVALQQGIRFNMFHLLQSVGRDGRTNIGAKGLTGEGYEGHYFWDTEIYVIPFFLYNRPEITRKLIEYRYSILDHARARARELAHPRGALFPWRTISGDECSAYFPAGTAQYHLGADVAMAIKRYMEATEDKKFLLDYGAEILFETARLWADLGAYIPQKGNKFCINEVTGPDEYSALVNNNCYTNMMARENLYYAYNTALWMTEDAPQDYARLSAKIGLERSELDDWKRAADNMYIPYDETLKLYLQDDGFLDKKPWDFANTPPENYPLLIHYHPLVIYRHQVCKQADLVLALFLVGDKFTLDEKRQNYDFYEKVTTHDSSLSTCTFSIVASEIGYHDKAYRYFMNTARMDLDDYHGNVKDGVHVANLAGTWMCLVNGFAGMRAYDGVLSLNPYLPAGWEEYTFKLNFRGRLLSVTVNKNQTIYTLLKGDALDILHCGQVIGIKAGDQAGRVIVDRVSASN